jgi:hypothetical protein
MAFKVGKNLGCTVELHLILSLHNAPANLNRRQPMPEYRRVPTRHVHARFKLQCVQWLCSLQIEEAASTYFQLLKVSRSPKNSWSAPFTILRHNSHSHGNCLFSRWKEATSTILTYSNAVAPARE